MPHAIRRILVAIKDPQVTESAAARKAAQLARALDAQLCLYHALTSPLYVEAIVLGAKTLARTEETVRAAVTAQLERLAAPLRTGDLKVTTDVTWDYPPHEAVTRAALRLEADLVAVDCPRQTHPASWFFRFTDWELLRSCPVPVLMIKNATNYTRAPILAALDPEHVGGKPASLDSDILGFGSALASALDDHLHAVHAFNPFPSFSATQSVIPQLLAELEQQAYSKAQVSLDPILSHYGMDGRRRHIEEGFAIDVIENVLRRTGAQILVLGSIARTGVKGLTIGNTAERMLDRVACDMLVVKPTDFVSPVPLAPRSLQIVLRSAPAATTRAAS